MELLESPKTRIAIYKYSKNASHLEIKEVVLIHCNVVNNNYQQNSKSLVSICS